MPRRPHPSAPPPPASGTRGPLLVAPGRQVAGRMASSLLHGAETEAEGCGGPAWAVDGHKDLQTQLPDFTASSLCLWTGTGAEGSPGISPPGGCSLPTGLLDLRFYLPLPLPRAVSVSFRSSYWKGLPPHLLSSPFPLPGGIESTPEPGGWAWPCTDFPCALQEKGSQSRERGAEALRFSLCLPPALPWCQIAITSSWNCSVATLGPLPVQPWEFWGREGVSVGCRDLVSGKRNISS